MSSSNYSTEQDHPIDNTTVQWIVKSMCLPTRETANKCGRAAILIKRALIDGEISSSKMEAMMIALGFSCERASCEKNVSR